MKRIKSIILRVRRPLNERGSALLVSLMVMVGLSLLGLGFMALSETENAISLNERNHTATVAVAEAGAKLVVQWFQGPTTMNTAVGGVKLMPDNADTIKTQRSVPTDGYIGYYKPAAGGSLLCDLPYGPKDDDRFFGEEAAPDIWIKASNSATFLTNLNAALFPNTDAGQITEIKIYAPPIIGGTEKVDASGNTFWDGGQPYGTATIAVTAQKLLPDGSVGAQAIVRIVVAPFPLPGPDGALQAIGSLAANGDFNVNWGAVESDYNINLKKQYSSLPWFNAYDRAHIERGYDSSTIWAASTAYLGGTYPLGATVRPTAAGIAANGAVALHEYVATTGGTSGNFEPNWPTTSKGTVGDGSVTWTERPPTMYPILVDATNYESHNWLAEVVTKTVQDPWFTSRSWGTVQGNSATLPHPYQYAVTPLSSAAGWTTSGSYPTHYFQLQTFDSPPDYKRVNIPKFDYNFWKAAALAGRGQPGVKYLSYVSSGNYSDGVTTQSVASWLGTGNGFYFLDTTNGLNPQGGGGTLDPATADPCGFQGFAYLNLADIKSTGCKGTSGNYPQPGEPFRDIGYRQVVETTTGTKTRGNWDADASGTALYNGAYNGKFDWQDLDWSNTGSDSTGSGTKNGMFDVYIAQKQFKRESDGVTITDWFPVEYYPGCKPGNNTCGTCNCSEPHEPYFNIRYSGSALNIQAGWNDPATAGYAKVTSTGLPSGTLATCSSTDVGTAAGRAKCTTNAYDIDGGLASIAPGIVGVLYNEGNFGSTGNGEYFGSIVVAGTTDPKGTDNIWFDERLIKGGWPPRGVTFPRVMVTSEQIQ